MVILWYYNGIIIGRRAEENAFFFGQKDQFVGVCWLDDCEKISILCSAYLGVKRNMPLLWTFLDKQNMGLPNTNNGQEGIFSDIKTKQRVHSGIIRELRKKIIDEYLSRHYWASPRKLLHAGEEGLPWTFIPHFVIRLIFPCISSLFSCISSL